MNHLTAYNSTIDQKGIDITFFLEWYFFQPEDKFFLLSCY